MFSLTWSSHSHRETLCPIPLTDLSSIFRQVLQWEDQTPSRKTPSFCTVTALKGLYCQSVTMYKILGFALARSKLTSVFGYKEHA